MLAAQAVTIDHASHGRLELALGAAWFEKEHHELGIPFPPTAERFDLLEDTLEIVTRLCTGDVVSYDGQAGVAARRPVLRPRPVQLPHPPIWIGGHRSPAHAPAGRPLSPTSGTASARRTRCARPTPASTSWPRPPAATRRPSCGPARCPSTISRRPGKHAAKWRDAGYGYLVCGWPGAGEAQVEAFVRDVLPGVRHRGMSRSASRSLHGSGPGA